ncbi:hypothetical protein Pst134EA_019366 [Puccinia striiformis f. sp. tritici]|uniref:hypothetical protein n=1 Tax=Puccinia striiformis f. sp. tritici TaxID=168172 RepID=UPI002008A820|nr:hypothetical protein Pst134EA_019366 [Puccinia striiformis f. sp. tritici]KAH9459217.1 hypothetical protein Pst134EA_019366 [Puccinia striiformis f. sp. tritici]
MHLSNFEAQTPSTDAPSPSVQSELSVDTPRSPVTTNPVVEGLFNQANNLLGSVTLAASTTLPDEPSPPNQQGAQKEQPAEAEKGRKQSPSKVPAVPKATQLPTPSAVKIQAPEKRTQIIRRVIPMSVPAPVPSPYTILAPPLGQKAVLIPSQPSSLVPNYPVLQEMTTAPYEPPTPSQPSEAMEIDQAEIQDPTAGEDRSMDIEPIQLNSYESQAITIYQSQHRLYQTAKGIGHMADMKRTLTECQRSYRDISKRLTWQFALNILDGWNPFQEAKHVKVLKTNQSRASPVASTSRLPTSSNSSSNPGSNGNTKGKGKKPEPNNLNQLGKIPKKDISWRETMAAARALQRAQAQMLEDLRKEEDEKSSKRRRKD